MKLHTVVSGGQTGADIAGWKAAKTCGLKTTGWMPKGFLTIEGPRPEYAELYGAKECDSESYPYRTRLNVEEADGTFCMAYDPFSRGVLCTKKAINRYSKPHCLIELRHRDEKWVEAVCRWLTVNEIGVLNVAGNRERSGIVEPAVYDFLCKVFGRLAQGEGQ